MSHTTFRRDLLLAGAIGSLGLAGVSRRAWGNRRPPAGVPGDHPDPRPGIDGSRVRTSDQLHDVPELIPLFDGIRRIPHVADGVRCTCGCAGDAGMRSLLSCFEGDAMAMGCIICQTEGRMVVRLHDAGRTLNQIRSAIDARFG